MAKLSIAHAVRAYAKIERLQEQLELLQKQLIEQHQLLVNQQRVVSELLEELAQGGHVLYVDEEDRPVGL